MFLTAVVLPAAVLPGCAPFTREALVDNASGLVLELSVASRAGAYPVRRQLVRVTGVS